jgi:uncharacterized membrane protein YoaK (UPF0700 family)
VRSGERDLLLFVLAASAGSADSWSYLGLGHAFVANMTGNTVLLGIAVFQDHGDLLHPAMGLGCYVVGAMIGSLLAGNLHPEAVWSKAVSLTLMLESVLMAGRRGRMDSDSSRRQTLACFATGPQPAAGLHSARDWHAKQRHGGVEDPRNCHHVHHRHMDHPGERASAFGKT